MRPGSPNSPTPADRERKARPAKAVLIAAGIALLAIFAFALWRLGPAWWPDREAPVRTQVDPEIERAFAAWSEQDDAPPPEDGPAAKFRADLYGIAEPLVEKLPDSPQARCLLASAHRQFARKADAAGQLLRCLELDAACVEAYYSLGTMALETADYPLAEKCLQHAFAIDYRWADVPLRLAQAQMSQGEAREAVATLEAYLTLEPAHAEAWCQLGQAYQGLGEFGNAKRCHLKAIEVNPDFLEAYYGVGKALRELGAKEDARAYFAKYGELRSAMTASVRVNKATLNDEDFTRTAIVDMATRAGAVYAMHGHLAEAEKCWTRVTQLDPTHIECRAMLCRLKPNDPQQWIRLGYLYLDAGRLVEAELPFQRVIDLAPQEADAYAALAEVYIRLGKEAEKALQLAEAAVQREATAANYFVLAAARERLEDWTGAESALTQAIERDPGDSRYREALARLQEAQRP